MTMPGALRRRQWLGLAGTLAAAWGPAPVRATPPRSADATAAAARSVFVGEAAEFGHRLRGERGGAAGAGAEAGPARRVALAIVGAGVAGLAAARAAREAGIDDLVVFDLHAQAGGNARRHTMRLGGFEQACPLGAHYLPVPTAANRPLWDWLHAIGLMRHEAGRSVPDERHLGHAPQERLWFEGAWHEGLMPPLEPGTARHRQAVQLARWVEAARREPGFPLPADRRAFGPVHAALDAQTFATALQQRGITDPALRAWLDYCCLDEHGAPAGEVSAWAGLHYFASRHGLHVPGAGLAEAEGREQVFTWPEGNAWLVERLLAGLGDRWLGGRLVTRVQAEGPSAMRLQVQQAGGGHEHWLAREVVLATPLHVARRIVQPAPAALQAAAQAAPQAAWLVANLMLDREPLARPGVPLAWDNVRHGAGPHLGYVHAGHQALRMPRAGGPRVLTAYRVWPWRERAALAAADAPRLAADVLDELALLHPDAPARVREIALTRHGHAMSIPVPGVRRHPALRALALGEATTPRLHWAHADLAGYSVFEEAFDVGHRAGLAAARALHRR